MDLREKLLEDAKRKVSESINEDNFIVQAITNIEELEGTANALAGRVREWYGTYLPELNVRDNQAFLKVMRKPKTELLKEFKVGKSMGADLKKEDLDPILDYGEKVQELFTLKDSLSDYLEKTMKSYCPNLQVLAGTTIGAKLLSEAGSLKQLALMRSTVIQLLGAEKALFRHLKTGAKPPRHGHIFAHPLIQGVKDKDRGKVARALADKLAIAVRADYFSKKFIGDGLRKELEERFS